MRKYFSPWKKLEKPYYKNQVNRWTIDTKYKQYKAKYDADYKSRKI